MSDETATAAGLGKLTSPDAVVLERTLPAPIERVWTYLTNPEHLSTWLAGGSLLSSTRLAC